MDNYNWNDAFPDTPKSFKNKVSATLDSLPDQKENDEMKNVKTCKKGSIKKRFIVALVATMVVGTTVFATGKISYIYGHGNNTPIYTTLPTVEKVKDDLGFNPKLVKEFDNGYIFKKGHTSDNEGIDDTGNCVAKTKSLNFAYTKGNDKLTLFMENGSLGEKSEKDIVSDTYNGIALYYNSYANKFVPANYKMTEQDKKDESSGKYVFSYGVDKEKICQVCHLSWMQDGINYSFLGMNSNISKDELVKMAHQVIDTK